MSLKTFHIIFISISSLLMIFILYWSLMNWNYYKDITYLSYSGVALLGLISLFIYGKQFIKKYKII